MQLECGGARYEWIGDWARLADSDAARGGWAHTGIVATDGGEVITFHPGEPAMLVLDRDGAVRRSWTAPVVEAHGITYTNGPDGEYLWVADNGSKRDFRTGYGTTTGERGGQVLKLTLDGGVAAQIERAPHPVYRDAKYSPTSVAVSEARRGGDGDVWVADGYGAGYVHRYDRQGRYLGSINGEEGRAGAFRTPHGVAVDWRKGEPELYVADRANHRIQVYDLDGRFKRVVGEEFLTSPSAFAFDGDRLVVGELRARLAVLDRDDRLIGYLGENEAVCAVEGWPNVKDGAGRPARTDRLVAGRFNSPHGVGADADGNLYVAEWLIGGRYTKLARV